MSTATTKQGLPIDPVTKKFVKRTAAAASPSTATPAPAAAAVKEKPEPKRPSEVLNDGEHRDPWWNPLI